MKADSGDYAVSTSLKCLILICTLESVVMLVGNMYDELLAGGGDSQPIDLAIGDLSV
jgi:hypothetical protein